MTQLKEPNDAHKMAGYMLRKSARRFEKYTNKAVKCLNTALTEEQLKGEDYSYFEIANQVSLIREAQAYVERVIEGVVHRELAQIADDKGYRPLTIADFNELGATGNR